MGGGEYTKSDQTDCLIAICHIPVDLETSVSNLSDTVFFSFATTSEPTDLVLSLVLNLE